MSGRQNARQTRSALPSAGGDEEQSSQDKLTLPEYVEKCHKQLMAFKFQRTDVSKFDNIALVPDQIVPWNEFPALHRELWDIIQKDETLMNDRRFPELEIKEQYDNITNAAHEVDKYQDEYLWDPMEMLLEALEPKRDIEQRYGSVDVLENMDEPESIWSWKQYEHEQPAFACVFLCPDEISQSMLLVGFHKMIQNNLVPGNMVHAFTNNFEGYAERVLAAAIVEIFAEMIPSQVRYGCLWTNNGCVFLKISDENPGIVSCHLSVPKLDTIYDNNKVNVYCTGIAQMLTFALNTIHDTPSQEWCHNVKKLKSFTGFPKMPYQTRSITTCTGSPDANYKSLAQKVINSHNSLSLRTGQHNRNREVPRVAEQYCTMTCLRGLITSGAVDPHCPNTPRHDPGGLTKKHPFAAPELLLRLKRQIDHDPERCAEHLHIRGNSGHLLKAIVHSHGYVVILKAVAERYASFTRHEINVYEVLRNLQGFDIPVCVGGLAPERGYWCHGERTTFMMVMGFAGERMDFDTPSEDREAWREKKAALEKQARECVQRIRAEGAEYALAWRNLLWNQELGRVIAVDFERAKVDRTAEGAHRKT
jgi:hypothetical protein